MCSSPALIYGAHRVLDDKRFCRLWPQQPRNCVKDLKDVLKQRLGTETIQHHYCNNEINISVWTVARESWPLGWGWRRGRILYMREEECLRCSWWGGWWCQCLSEQILRSVFECHSADTWWIFPANEEKKPSFVLHTRIAEINFSPNFHFYSCLLFKYEYSHLVGICRFPYRCFHSPQFFVSFLSQQTTFVNILQNQQKSQKWTRCSSAFINKDRLTERSMLMLSRCKPMSSILLLIP